MTPQSWYVPVAPPHALTGLLACSWTARPDGNHLLVPDACTDILWTSRSEMWLCGPETKGWNFALKPGTTAVGVRFLPGRLSAVFDVDTSIVRNQRIRLGSLLGDHIEQTLSGLIEQAPSSDRLNVLEQFVSTLPVSAKHQVFAAFTVDFLTAKPRTNNDELAADLGITTRQLHRRCTYGFGYGLSTLARILRFQRFLAIAEIAIASTERTIAQLAINAGYADQAHLGRDCRTITGQTPKKFLASYFPTFPNMSDPYKTRVRFDASVAV
jgi:AraC-like DNA-binding protein